VSFGLRRGRTLGIVGESGCGKSVTALSIMRLIGPPGRIVEGEILFEGKDLARLPEEPMRRIRGNRISMIFQEPMTSLNPVFTVGSQIMEAILLHQKTTKREARRRTVEMLDRVRIPAPAARVDEYPHQLSGGMRQRVMIAMALACTPELLIADEPSTALDVTVQAQILDLMLDLQKDLGMSIILITHDLGVVAEIADDVVVMYASKVVEQAPAGELYAEPLHPYTQGLFRSLPKLGMSRKEKLKVIPGTVPDPLHFPGGCAFHPRCPVAVGSCRETPPTLREIRPGHFAGCDLIDA
ncbi:MAG: ABC transporter ATP-binding protein, partial [Planctomycetota bacterium]